MAESHVNEHEWVESLLRRFRTPDADGGVGIGDDAAVSPLPPGEVPVLTVDVMVDGVHFRDGWLGDAELGSRVLRVSVSDIAAMAATPRGALFSIETPELPGRVGDEFWDGVEATLGSLSMELLGGNVTRTPGPLSISCTVLGSVPPGRAVRRDGARAGDSLWVTGTPGAAGAARRAIEAGGAPPEPCPWRQPTPRVAAAKTLAEADLLHAAIDLSDGLGIDLARLLAASDVGAAIDLSAVAERLPALDAEAILEGGEDYELLFASPSSDIDLDVGVPLTRIGTITAERDLVVSLGGLDVPYRPRGWDPFSS